MVKYYEILENISIQEGDILDVSSDILQMLLNCRKHKETFDPNLLIDSIQQKVGTSGTIMIRTWNWSFCQGKTFDIKTTPSAVGSLGNFTLKRKDFRRTQHPLYSFAVWGKYQDKLCDLKNISAWGNDSPFAFLTENNGKQLMLGSTMWNSLAYVHYVEEQTEAKYRYLKNFSGNYIDEDGNESVRTYQMYVRDLDLDVKMTPQYLAPIFFEKGILQTWDFDSVSVSIVDLKKAYPIIQDDILNNRSRMFCVYKGQND